MSKNLNAIFFYLQALIIQFATIYKLRQQCKNENYHKSSSHFDKRGMSAMKPHRLKGTINCDSAFKKFSVVFTLYDHSGKYYRLLR